MKNGFAMIELIFAIVSLGILSSIAIPKLLATTGDVRISKSIVNLKVLLQDISNYYKINGKFPENTSENNNKFFYINFDE